MKEIFVNIWDYQKPNNYIGVTTNGVVQEDGRLIMGGGIAKEARDRFKNIDWFIGFLVKTEGNNVYMLGSQKVFTFPTKTDPWKRSDLKLIEQSCKQLKEFMAKLPNIEGFYLPRPGCGLGGLNWKTEVKPIVEKYFADEDRLFIVGYPGEED